MDRFSGGWGNSFYPTSNSAYGSGVLSSMRKAEEKQGGPNFNPAATNYYFPQQSVITTSGGGQWQQPFPGAHGHVHAPNCPNFGTGAYTNTNTKYPSNFGGGQGYQIPGMPSGSNAVPTTDHIEVLQGEAAQAYLAQRNGDTGTGQSQHASASCVPEPNNVSEPHTGMTVSFQTDPGAAEIGGGGEVGQSPLPSSSSGGVTTASRQQKGQYVKVNGLPMDRNPRWRQANPTMPHVYSSIKGSTSQPAFKLCGKCPKCKDLQDPGALRPSALNFRQEGVMPSGSRRFPLPRGVKSPKQPQPPGQGIPGGQGQPISLPIQGENITVSGPPPGPGTGNAI